MRAAAHDLRNLIAIIRGFAEIGVIDIECSRASISGCHARFQKIVAAADDCEKIIQVSLNTVAIQSGEKFDLNGLARKVSGEVEEAFMRAGIGLKLALHESAILISGDPLLMSRALLNLCINSRDAIKVRSGLATGHVTISTRSDDRLAIIEVADDGVGMDTRLLTDISLEHPTGEHGHGLRVVRKTADKFGGWVDVDSIVGIGTRISISLPLSKPAEFSEKSAAAAA